MHFCLLELLPLATQSLLPVSLVGHFICSKDGIQYYNNPTRCSCAQLILFHCSVTLHVSGAFHAPVISTSTVSTASGTGHTSAQLPSSNVAEFELMFKLRHVGGR